MALPSVNRLPLRNQRERIDKEGVPSHSSLFTVVKASSPAGIAYPRVAVLVSKKISPLAVDRNLIKRRILNSITPLISQIPSADYLIIPKRSVKDEDYEKINSDLKSLLK